MNEYCEIGSPPWTDDDLRNNIEEFAFLYQSRPIVKNSGGMHSPHMFYMWFMLRFLKPETVVESGVHMGQGTWFIEQAVPEAKVFSIDPRPRRRKYTSSNVEYSRKDFSKIDFAKSLTPDTFLFFDDHQNAFERLKFVSESENGYKMAVFEDNYPIKRGDCLILKKILDKNGKEAEVVKSLIKTYYEFPPIFIVETTRWKDAWENSRYPTKDPLFHRGTSIPEYLEIFLKEAKQYTWMAYVELK